MDQNSGAPMMDATSATDSNADFNINIQDQLGVPPAPPIPDFLANEPSMPEVTPEAVTTKETVTPGLNNNETAGNEGVNMQFEEVKKQMLQDLYPLMDKIKMQPEQKFKVYKQMIESTGSKDMITSAYEAVKGIGDEAERAEALLFLVEKADS